MRRPHIVHNMHLNVGRRLPTANEPLAVNRVPYAVTCLQFQRLVDGTRKLNERAQML